MKVRCVNDVAMSNGFGFNKWEEYEIKEIVVHNRQGEKCIFDTTFFSTHFVFLPYQHLRWENTKLQKEVNMYREQYEGYARATSYLQEELHRLEKEVQELRQQRKR